MASAAPENKKKLFPANNPPRTHSPLACQNSRFPRSWPLRTFRVFDPPGETSPAAKSEEKRLTLPSPGGVLLEIPSGGRGVQPGFPSPDLFSDTLLAGKIEATLLAGYFSDQYCHFSNPFPVKFIPVFRPGI